MILSYEDSTSSGLNISKGETGGAVSLGYARGNIAGSTTYTFYFKLVPGWGAFEYPRINSTAEFIVKADEVGDGYVTPTFFTGAALNDSYFGTDGGQLGVGTGGTNTQGDPSADFYAEEYGMYKLETDTSSDTDTDLPVDVQQLYMYLDDRRAATSTPFYSFGLKLRETGVDTGTDGSLPTQWMVATSSTAANDAWTLHDDQAFFYWEDPLGLPADDIKECMEWMVPGTMSSQFLWIAEDGNFKPFIQNVAASVDTGNPNYIQLDFDLIDIPTSDGETHATEPSYHRDGYIHDTGRTPGSATSSTYVQYAGPYSTDDASQIVAGDWTDLNINATDTGTTLGLDTSNTGESHWLKSDFGSMTDGYYFFRIKYKAYGTVGVSVGAASVTTAGWSDTPARLSDYEVSDPILWGTLTVDPVVDNVHAQYTLLETVTGNITIHHDTGGSTVQFYSGDLQYKTVPDGTWTNIILHNSTPTDYGDDISTGSAGSSQSFSIIWDVGSNGNDCEQVTDETSRTPVDYKIRIRVADMGHYSDWVESNIFNINRLPAITSLSGVQNTSRVNLSYIMVDKGADDCNLNTRTTQTTWSKLTGNGPDASGTMTLIGSVSDLESSAAGTVHTGDLDWDIITDIGPNVIGTYRVILQPHDGLEYGTPDEATVSVNTGPDLQPARIQGAYVNTDVYIQWPGDIPLSTDTYKAWNDADSSDTWNVGDTLIEDYNIYRREASSRDYGDPINGGPIRDTGYWDRTTVPGKTYTYMIRGIYDLGQATEMETPDSNEITIRIPQPVTDGEYFVSNTRGVHLPKEPLLGVVSPTFEEFIDVATPHDPALLHHRDLRLKLGYSVPDDNISLNAYHIHPLKQEDILELIDMTQDLRFRTNLSATTPVKPLINSDKYHDRALVSNIYWFDSSQDDFNRVKDMLSAVNAYSPDHVANSSVIRKLAERVLFFSHRCLWQHSEPLGDNVAFPWDWNYTSQYYVYKGDEIYLNNVPKGGKYMIVLIPETDGGYRPYIYTNFIGHHYNTQVVYNILRADGSVAKGWVENLVSDQALKRKVDDNFGHYDIVDGYIYPDVWGPYNKFFVAETGITLAGSTTGVVGKVDTCPWQDVDTQWQIRVAANKMHQDIRIGDLLIDGYQNNIGKNNRVGRIPFNLLENASLKTTDKIELHYDMLEYDRHIEVPDEHSDDTEYTEVDYGHIRVKGEMAKVIGTGTIQVKNGPIVQDPNKHGIYVYIYGVGGTGYSKYALVQDGTAAPAGTVAITNWSLNPIERTIEFADELISYNNSDIIYVDYTYREDYVVYDGFREYQKDIGWVDWYFDMNPRAGHGFTYEGEKESLRYEYGSGGLIWWFVGKKIYNTDTLYPRVYLDNGSTLTEITQAYWESFDHSKGKLKLTSAAIDYYGITPTSTLVADYISRYTSPLLMFRNTAYVYAIPNRAIARDDTGGIIYEFGLTGPDEGTLQHTFNSLLFDKDSEHYDPSLLLIAKIRLTAPVCMKDVEMIDSRERGGEVLTSIHKWDSSSPDGKIISGNQALVVRLPAEIKSLVDSDYMTHEEVKEIVGRHMAAGTQFIIEYYDVEEQETI
jgi:hypothetical protein